jgi:hypothetical protein
MSAETSMAKGHWDRKLALNSFAAASQLVLQFEGSPLAASTAMEVTNSSTWDRSFAACTGSFLARPFRKT